MSSNFDITELTVDEYTTPSPLTVGKDAKISDILNLMEENKVRHIPVIDGKKAVGILSERELRVVSGLGNGSESLLANDVMTKSPYCVTAETPLETVALEMSSRKIGSAIVCNKKDEITGIFTSTDALNALIEVLRGDVN